MTPFQKKLLDFLSQIKFLSYLLKCLSQAQKCNFQQLNSLHWLMKEYNYT